jgi:DNA sulfur modification protein DndE
MIETLRLSRDQRNKLMKIRKKTGIKNWNVLCRWALCMSLAESTPPPAYSSGGKAGIEIDWATFTGKELHFFFDAIVRKLGKDLFYNHIQRGIELLLGKDLQALLTTE